MSVGRPTCAASGAGAITGPRWPWVIDCHTKELLGWHLSRSGRSKTAESALEQALISRYGHLGRVKYRSCCDLITGWSLPAEATRPRSKAMGCSKSSSRPKARSKTRWSSELSEPSKTNALTITDSRPCGTPAALLAIGLASTTTDAHVRH